MSVDLRTEINDADNVTGFADTSKTPALNTDSGQRYEGTGSIEIQHSNANAAMTTTQNSGGGGTFSYDFSDVTFYFLMKDNLVESLANGGIQAVIGDGTDLIGFDIAGYDVPGMDLPFYYRAFKLDCSNLPSGSNVTYAGVEGNLTLTAITQVGMGTLHLAKAVGNVVNSFLDRMSFGANGSYHFRINGGTSGTPETMPDVAGDDLTNGWAAVANPLGAQYVFFCSTEWGEPTANADAYFTASNEQWFLLGDNSGGHAAGTGNFMFRVIGNTTDTISFVIDNVSIVNTGTAAPFDFSDANITICKLDAVSFVGLGAIALPPLDGTNKYATNCIYNGCGQITSNGSDSSGSKVSGYTGASDTSAFVWNETTDPNGKLDDMEFVKGSGTTHGLELGTSVPDTINLPGTTFSGYNASNEQTDSAIYVRRTTGTVTINVAGSPSYKSDGATVVIQNPITVTFTGMKDNTEVRVYASGFGAEIAGIEDATAGSPGNRSFAWTEDATTVVDYTIHNVDYETITVIGYVVPATNTSIPIQQRFDRNKNNPA